ncbi:nuclear transport factor 2 family protein [Sphingobacterium oryzagri]|uniref:Nuclear transport factor 2 family protein n=1 Tax=Sphingobacterium oryzagri TaxID=3025669 RepID=A0ABY7WJ90_9SPHI|nr:nuclear transport factor 2 family protein [Sphingobacterium sp. KACC 22765]WDF68637.1 nuclear transport factor 2 family protein [Sphingobacterium sp. KACC 22765]
MKKIVASIAAAIMIMITYSSFAAEKRNPLKHVASTKVITTYLEATTLGSIDLNSFLFADDFQYRNSVNKTSYNKKAYTKFLREHKGVRFDCTTSYEILDQSGLACVAKATIVFKNFTRVDYITLNQDQDGWKITKVITTYP